MTSFVTYIYTVFLKFFSFKDFLMSKKALELMEIKKKTRFQEVIVSQTLEFD